MAKYHIFAININQNSYYYGTDINRCIASEKIQTNGRANLKHFPKTPKVVTAAQMMEILDCEE